jgi:hypothetical protein
MAIKITIAPWAPTVKVASAIVSVAVTVAVTVTVAVAVKASKVAIAIRATIPTASLHAASSLTRRRWSSARARCCALGLGNHDFDFLVAHNRIVFVTYCFSCISCKAILDKSKAVHNQNLIDGPVRPEAGAQLFFVDTVGRQPADKHTRVLLDVARGRTRTPTSTLWRARART